MIHQWTKPWANRHGQRLGARFILKPTVGLLNNSGSEAVEASEKTTRVSERECSKKFVQQGRSRFDARSVLSVREHGKRARTPLAAFFNIPNIAKQVTGFVPDPGDGVNIG